MNLTNDQSFPKRVRLRTQADFDLVYQEDHFSADKMLVIRARRNGLSFSRIGLSVSRRVGNAVVRNRWKRLIREAFRTQKNALPPGLDLVVRPRKGAIPEFEAICRSLLRQARKLDRKVPQDDSR